MNLTRLLSTTVLLATLTAFGPAYAQDPGAAHGTPDKGWMMQHQHMEDILSQLPPEKAKLFKESMKPVHEKNREIFEKIHKLQDEKTAILTADKFDKTAYLAKSAEIDKMYDQIRATRNEAFVSVASQFNAAERKVLAKMHEGPMMPPPPPPHEDAKTPAEHAQQPKN